MYVFVYLSRVNPTPDDADMRAVTVTVWLGGRTYLEVT